jgi:hypothetical protein
MPVAARTDLATTALAAFTPLPEIASLPGPGTVTASLALPVFPIQPHLAERELVRPALSVVVDDRPDRVAVGDRRVTDRV